METQFTDIGGPVHYVDFGGTGPTFVLVHGLGGSHVNWFDTGRLLAEHGRVLAIDLVGFGKTPPAGRSSAVQANREVLSAFLHEVEEGPAILVGNSMGGLISLLQAAEEPDTVAGLVLVNPAIPPPAPSREFDAGVIGRLLVPTIPVVGHRLLGLRKRVTTPERYVDWIMEFTCADSSRVSAGLIDATVALSHERRAMPWANRAFGKASQSIAAILARRSRYLERAYAVQAPTLFVHGDQDRVVAPSAARWLAAHRPDWTFVMLEENGHVPMIETPELFVSVVSEWLAGPGSPALEAAG